ncbi:MAG TPA: hypothetical protein VHZ95_01085, partial [Polyangiales bacterium]|nr:hypothetical protein [Polyangiales bacterium]
MRADDADEAAASSLSLLLPAEADACVVARPSLLPRELGPIYAPIAQAEGWVWDAPVHALVYAQASWQRAGRPHWLSLLRFDGDAALLRAWLGEHAGLDLHWDETAAISCDAERCPTLAQFIDAHTLRLVRGALPAAPQQRAGPCALLVRAHPQAFENSFRRGEALFIDASSDVALETSAFATRSASGVIVQREEQMGDESAAQRGVERDACRELWGSGSHAFDAVCERTRDGVRVRTTARIDWDDLRLRRDDADRHALAQHYADALDKLRPDDAIDWKDLADVLRELAVRRALLAASGADPKPQARELARFVARALAFHPDDPQLIAAQRALESVAGQRER